MREQSGSKSDCVREWASQQSLPRTEGVTSSSEILPAVEEETAALQIRQVLEIKKQTRWGLKTEML
jgi:hypothetical protein